MNLGAVPCARPVVGLPAEDLPEVEAKRLLQLRTGASGRLGVLQLLEVKRKPPALLLDPVQLGGEPATLVRFGEDNLCLLERAVVLGDLLDRVRQELLDPVRLPARGRRERRNEVDVG